MTTTTPATRELVEVELDIIAMWADEYGWSLAWNSETSVLTVDMHAPDGECYVFEFRVQDYPALPPFVHALHPQDRTLRDAPQCFPTGGNGYFHGNNLICAPWSRSAYAKEGGPHRDWNLVGWQQIRPNDSTLPAIAVLLQQLLDGPDYKGRRAR